MVGLDHLEFSYHDENIAELGQSPADVELVVPRFILRERKEEIKYWDQQMELALAKLRLSGTEVKNDLTHTYFRLAPFFPTFQQPQGPTMSLDEAVLLLQRHERARQGRLRAKLMQEIRFVTHSYRGFQPKSHVWQMIDSLITGALISWPPMILVDGDIERVDDRSSSGVRRQLRLKRRRERQPRK